MITVAKDGHNTEMFRIAVSLFKLLKAFDTSTRSTASFVGWSTISLMACMAASQPDSSPAQSCRGPAAVLMSSLRTYDIARAII